MSDMTPIRSRLNDAVADAMRRGEDTHEQAKVLLATLRGDPELYQMAMAPNEHATVMRLLRQGRAVTRAVIFERPSAPDIRARTALIAGNASIYDFPLPSGKRLGDATREEVLHAAEDYDARAKANAAKARFLRNVAEQLPEGVLVRDALSETEIEGAKE